MSCSVVGTGGAGTDELESRDDWGVSLSLLHLPPGVKLLIYHGLKAGGLQYGPTFATGDQQIHGLLATCCVHQCMHAPVLSASRQPVKVTRLRPSVRHHTSKKITLQTQLVKTSHSRHAPFLPCALHRTARAEIDSWWGKTAPSVRCTALGPAACRADQHPTGRLMCIGG